MRTQTILIVAEQDKPLDEVARPSNDWKNNDLPREVHQTEPYATRANNTVGAWIMSLLREESDRSALREGGE